MADVFKDGLAVMLGKTYAEWKNEASIDYQFRTWKAELRIALDAALIGDRAGAIAALKTIGEGDGPFMSSKPRSSRTTPHAIAREVLQGPPARFGNHPQIGDTLKFTENVNREPSFIANVTGAHGTIMEAGETYMTVRVDDVMIPGAEEWDNEIYFDVGSDNYFDFWLQTTPIFEGDHVPVDVDDFMLGYCNVVVDRGARTAADKALFAVSVAPFLETESATVIPFQSNPAKKRTMKKNPGEAARTESLDMAAGRYYGSHSGAFDALDERRKPLTHAKETVREELEVVADAYEAGGVSTAMKALDAITGAPIAYSTLGTLAEPWHTLASFLLSSGDAWSQRVRLLVKDGVVITVLIAERARSLSDAEYEWINDATGGEGYIGTRSDDPHDIMTRSREMPSTYYYTTLMAHGSRRFNPDFIIGFWMELYLTLRGREGAMHETPRENPGEIRTKESLDMQAGRLQARDAWHLDMTEPTRIMLEGDMLAELETASDALEQGGASAAGHVATILSRVGRMAGEMRDIRATKPGEWHEYWGQATNAVTRAGTLVFFTDEPHPSSEDAITTYLEKTTSVTYMQAVNGAKGYAIVKLRANRRINWFEFDVGFWMEILRYERKREIHEDYRMPNGKMVTLVLYRTLRGLFGARLETDGREMPMPISFGTAEVTSFDEASAAARRFLDKATASSRVRREDPTENPAPATVALAKLFAWRRKVEDTITDVAEGRLSFSGDAPIKVSRLDTPRGAFWIMDGHHRAVEAVLAGKKSIAIEIDPDMPRIERTGGGYRDVLADRVNVAEFVATHGFADRAGATRVSKDWINARRTPKKNPGGAGRMGMVDVDADALGMGEYWGARDFQANVTAYGHRWAQEDGVEILRVMSDAIDVGDKAAALAAMDELGEDAVMMVGLSPAKYWTTPHSKMDEDIKARAIARTGQAAKRDFLIAYWVTVITAINEEASSPHRLRGNPGRGRRRNPGNAAPAASEEHFADRDDAIAKYKEFWRLDPETITVDMDVTIPTHVSKIGKAHAILYRSGKVDPETLEKVKKPIDYIHHIEKGVYLYGGQGDVEVPEFIRGKDGVTSLTRLGDCLGWQVKVDGVLREAEGVAPLPELYAIPSGKALLVIQDKRDVLAIIWGGELGVEDVGIVH